ncbi:MAG: helix-turn-helix transcriptional regulator [Bacteroidota bacterium]
MAKKKIQTPEEFLETFAIKLKRLRKAKKISAVNLADLLKMNKSAISRLESGDANPSLLTLRKLSIALGYKLEDFFKGVK